MSVSPDEGMQLLTQRMSADRITRDGAPDSPAGGPGLEVAAGLDFILSLSSAVKENTRALRERGARPRIPWQACHPIPLAPVSIAAAGQISDERWEPREDWAWQILAVSVVFGAGTTQATVYRDFAGAHDQRNQQVTGFLWEPRAQFLLPGQRLVFTSVGGGITVSGDAVEIGLDWLPDYLI